MECKNYYKFVFICINNVNIEVECNSKMEAIEKFSKEYESLFNSNWNVYQINRKISLDDSEQLYL